MDEATREADRVDTALEILVKRMASEGVNEPDDNGWRVFSKSMSAGILSAFLH